MPKDSLGKLVDGVDRERAGRFSRSVPNRSMSARQVCPACRQVPDYAAHRAAYEKPWLDAGWLPDAPWRDRSWGRKKEDGGWQWEPYTYERPAGCPTCGSALVDVEGW